LTPDDVKAVVVTNQPAITACIRQHARGTPVEGGGRFLVRWSVLPSGGTSSVSMETDTLKATSLAHCIEEVVRSWKFPAHQVRMQEPIRFPFVF
ncbi:MAG TPA: AgmX/PglI C-terminal domain-containing protein, partial [Archangium sp.]|nr:AgmX/PglI C-terminal domain-containing protein [Archangium sp.]